MKIDNESLKIRNRVWSEAAVALIENKLRKVFNESILVDSTDFWVKQLEYGTAKENKNYSVEEALKIAAVYGVKYFRENGETGIYMHNEESNK